MRLIRLFRPGPPLLIRLRNAGLIIILAAVGYITLAQPNTVPEMALTTTPSPLRPFPTLTPTPTPFPPPETTFDPTAPPFIPTVPPGFPVPGDFPTIGRGEEVSDTLTTQKTSMFYNYEADAGEIVIFQLVAPPPIPTFYVDLTYGAEYVYDALPNDENGNQVQTVTKVMPETRIYTVRLDSADPFGPPRPFTLRRIVPEINSMALGESKEGQMGLDLPVAIYTFTCSEGDLISLFAQSEFPTQLSLFYLSDEAYQSTELISSGYAYGYGSSSIDLFRLPSAGRYAVVVKRMFYYGDAIPTDAQPFTIRASEVIPIEMAYGDTVEGELNAETSALYYSFDGQYGDVISARVETDGGEPDTLLTLYSPERYEIISDDDGSLGLDPEIYRFPLTQYGPVATEANYILRVRASQIETYGAFSLTLDGSSAELGEEPVIWRWNNKGLVNSYYVEAEAGETLLLKMRVLRGANTPNVNVTQGQTQLLYVTATTLEEVEATFTVPQNGRVLVTLDSAGRFLESEISVTRVE